MKRVLCVLALGALALTSVPAWSKSRTIRIEISAASLAVPLEITDPAIVDHFNIWNGPGVGVNGQPVHMNPHTLERIGAFIDWPRGKVSARPTGTKLFDVVFHQGGRERMQEWHRRYVIRYAYDPATDGGYIYLPGRNDGDDHIRNVFSIVHGIEGNWFHSSTAWERLVRPLIEGATRAPTTTHAARRGRDS